MRRTACLGLFLTLFAALAAPGFAQEIKDPAEYKAYFEGVYSEKDLAKKAANGEKFLNDYKETVARNQTYMMILLSYAQIPNWPKALETADKQAQMAPKLEPNDKKQTLLVGMTAAEQAKNTPKLKEYANKVLESDPKNIGALITLSGLLANSLPTEEAAKNKQLEETLAITKRALAEPKPASATDAQWNPILVQLHDTVAMVYLNQKKYAETVTASDDALKLNKKDGYAYYLKGLAMKPAVKEAIDKYTAAVEKMNLEENRKADQLVRDELQANAQGLLSAATTKKDDLAQIFAKSVATGWANAAAARTELKQVFTGTPAEMDKLIDDMKVEINKVP